MIFREINVSSCGDPLKSCSRTINSFACAIYNWKETLSKAGFSKISKERGKSLVTKRHNKFSVAIRYEIHGRDLVVWKSINKKGESIKDIMIREENEKRVAASRSDRADDRAKMARTGWEV